MDNDICHRAQLREALPFVQVDFLVGRILYFFVVSGNLQLRAASHRLYGPPVAESPAPVAFHYHRPKARVYSAQVHKVGVPIVDGGSIAGDVAEILAAQIGRGYFGTGVVAFEDDAVV